MDDLRAVLVCVDFADLLAVTLPYNRHHFKQVLVVTTPLDRETLKVAKRHQAEVYVTNAFYDHAAAFNKWVGLEEALDSFGRVGWLCLMDVDILWPQEIVPFECAIGSLYTPYRHIFSDVTRPIPAEHEWSLYPIHPGVDEFSGYSQIFHAQDSVLGPAPWHELDWVHAGGADSFFQAKWSPNRKIRPPFEVLHLGEPGANWCGRVTPYLIGGEPVEASWRLAQVKSYLAGRERAFHCYAHEKLGSLAVKEET